MTPATGLRAAALIAPALVLLTGCGHLAAAGASQPGLLADALVLLIEGARVSRRSVGTEGPSANFVRTSEAVIASFGIPPKDRPGRAPSV